MLTVRRVVDPVVLVPKPTADDEVRQSVIDLLRETLADAEAGKIITALIIIEQTNGEWGNRWSGTTHFAETIGRLEVTKYEMIKQFADREAAK
jgi:hypothetical protein